MTGEGEERQEKAGRSRGARRKEARGRNSFCPRQCQESSLRVPTFPSTKYWPLLSLGIWRRKQLTRLTRQHAVTQAQMVPMFLYNPLVHPIKQTITPWQIHFNKAPCYYRAQRLPEDESHCRCGQATAPTQLSSTVPSADGEATELVRTAVSSRSSVGGEKALGKLGLRYHEDA